MKQNEFSFFFSIFKILFNAQKAHVFNDEWVREKKKNDDSLNEICVSYLTNLTKTKESNNSEDLKKDLILLGALLRKKFKIRALVSRYFNFIDSVNLKCVIAIIFLYIQLLKNYVSQIFSIPFKFQIDENLAGKNVSFVIGFPNHSFNFKKNSKNYPSSFAEYFIKAKAEIPEKNLIISLDEYHRKSISKESSRLFWDTDISRLDTIKSSKKFCITSLYEKVKNLAEIIFQSNIRFFGIYLLECALKMSSISHQNFIQKIGKCNQVIDVYILPFSEYLMLPFCKELQKKCNIYYYSDNILIPPASSNFDFITTEDVDKFNDGNYSSFCGLSNASGFLRANNYLKKMAEDIFFKEKQKESLVLEEMPSMLGFESLLKVDGLSEVYTVSIFDVPPESGFQQFCRSASGDKTSDIEFVSDFLNDIKSSLFELNIRVLYKPKYSLSNYVDEYQSLIASLGNSMEKRFIVLDPYVRVGDIIEKSDLVVSMPYTSTKRFADYYGKKSIYYVPSKYENVFRGNCGYVSETIYGKNELKKFVNKKQRGEACAKCG